MSAGMTDREWLEQASMYVCAKPQLTSDDWLNLAIKAEADGRQHIAEDFMMAAMASELEELDR